VAIYLSLIHLINLKNAFFETVFYCLKFIKSVRKRNEIMNTYIKSVTTLNGRKARLVISDNNWLEDSAVEQFKKVMELSGMCCGVGMPDLHPGKGQPIGAAFVTHNCIYPHLVGSDIGCGMGLWQLDIPIQKVKLDKWEKQLTGLDDLWDGDIEQWLLDRQVTTNDLSLLSENSKLGTIGGGNHFSEFQQVDAVLDELAFNKSGIDKQSVVLLVHSGSRGLGQKILREHVDNNGATSISIIEQRKELEQYIQRHNYAMNWAVANRALIAERFCQKLKTQGRPLLDVTHNMVEPLMPENVRAMGLPIEPELSTKKSKSYWIHRKGASPTNKGLVMIPGSRGSWRWTKMETQ